MMPDEVFNAGAAPSGPEPTDATGELDGISELFGLGSDQSQPDPGGRPSGDTVGRWVAAAAGTVYGSADQTSRLVHGRYRLIAELGQGGMGVTYRAWDTQAHVPVVVKMPKREVRHDQEVMARFAREIVALRAVPQGSIVPITDSGDDEGCPFVVMRFLPGGSLADYRRRDEADNPIKNPPGMLHFWLPGVAAALDHIHSKGMLHRDVKPGNVFLDGFLKPFLGDFGIAKVVDESGGLAKEQTLTATKTAVGTPEYMAPELFKPKTLLDGRVDQYALAVTVYEMLSGEKPFTGSTSHIIVEHSSQPVPSLERKCPGLVRSVYEAVHRGLAKKPEERFATCSEFAAAVLAGIAALEPEADTVRLLCPACRNILKLPSHAAGRSGRCPRCRSEIDVAADLGSLWLESEERGGGAAGTVQPAVSPQNPAEVLAEEKPRRRWGLKEWAALVVAVCGGLLIGYQGGMFRERAALWNDLQQSTKASTQGTAADTDTIVSLTVEEARRLVARPSRTTLSLDGLKTITPEVARELSRLNERGGWVRELSLDGLGELPLDVARELRSWNTPLSLDGLTSITPEVMAALCAKGGTLSLNGLKSLSPECTSAIPQDGCGGLSLDGLHAIDPRTAEVLCKSFKGSLSLGGLVSLPVEVAEKLIGCNDLTVSVGGALTEELAGIFQPDPKAFGANLTLKNVGTLSVSAAAALPKRDMGQPLKLHGLKQLSIEAATLLAGSQVEIFIDGTKTLSPDAVRALAQNRKPLSLKIDEISEESARALVDVKSSLWLTVPDLAPSLAMILAQKADPLIIFTPRVSYASAVALAGHRGPIALVGEEDYAPELSPAAAAMLKSTWGIYLHEQAFIPGWLFTWCATGLTRTIVILLWCSLLAGLAAVAWGSLALRRVVRRFGVNASAAPVHEAARWMRRTAMASGVVCGSIAVLGFVLGRHVFPWRKFMTNIVGTSLPGGYQSLLFFLGCVAVVWLLMLASHGRRLRQIRMSAQVCGIVPGRTISRILWWLGAMVIFVWGMGVWTMFLVSFNHYPTVNNGQVEKGVRIDNLIDHLRKWDWAFIDDDRVLAALAVWVSLLLLLPMAVWSLARPKVRWCAAVANMLLAVGIVAIAAGLVTSFHASAELPVPHGFGVVTAWWIVPIVAGWALVQTGRTMIGLFSSPLGGIPSHACCQAGVLTSFGRLIPWERFTSYDWLSETLVLRRAPLWGIPRLVRGTVPTAERAAADELLAARLPRDDMRVFGDRGEGIAVRDIAAGCALLFVGCAAIGLRGMVVLACCALIAGPAAIAWGAWTLRGIARRSGPQASAAVIPEVRGSLQRVAIASGVVCFCIAMLAFLLVRSGAGMIDSSACGLIFGAPVVIAWMWPLAVCGRWVREIRKHAQVCCIAASPKSGPMSWWLVVWLVFLVCVLWWNVLMFGHALGREPVWSWSVMMAVGTVILLAIWLWSRARPAVLWLSAAARVALACMVVQFVNLATFAVDSAFPTQQPYRMVLATVSCVIPAVGAWALFQLGRSVVGLYSSPLGGIPSHACCQDGVLMSFGRLIPWERFTSYDWLGETLVLRRAPLWGIPRLVRGTVPTAERAAADELLAARLPRYEPHRSETGNE